ncbi:MAG: nitroreductase family protein, partial [Acidimicrobiia bacterium]|nr:nitroreductase family protein [Acidimicrobiia bacterium]
MANDGWLACSGGVELWAAIRGRRMVRSFAPDAVEAAAVDRVVDAGHRAPAAGATDGRAFVVLEGPGQSARYWDVTLPAGERRDHFTHPGLLAAPVLVVVWCRPDAYVERYAEPDKDRSATLGATVDDWPQPYWWVDAGCAVEAMLLAAVDEGLGACLFGLFDHEAAVAGALGVPAGWRAVGTIALGVPGG